MAKKAERKNFIEQMIDGDLEKGVHNEIITRFPPEPNGYLHIGHAKSIVLNFGLGGKYNGKTNLRFDDTNPVTEETEYVNSIQNDIKWLGFEWTGDVKYTSDYFQQLFDFAVKLINKGLAYVDDSTPEEIAEQKGSPKIPGKGNDYRNRSIEENLALFLEMKEGKFEDGAKVLRAKIDLANPNMLMRDPLMYRIKKATHHRTGDDWCIYPMYDFAHGQSDSIENITHSICTLEFENHRPLYNWFIKHLEIYPSRQIEFARLNLSYTVMSKRKMLILVKEGLVMGWDDPRMPTISGMRRRGYTAKAIREFSERVGIAKRENLIDLSMLEFSVRKDLNEIASRVMVVQDPVKLVITNYPVGKTEQLPIEINPQMESSGNRLVPFSREIFIERSDFMEDPPEKFFRLGQGRDVRLKGAYKIHCTGFERGIDGKVAEVHCTYYENSKSGEDTSGIRTRGTIHWVNKQTALPVEIRLFEPLFTVEQPLKDKDIDFQDFINPDSLKIIDNALAEPYLKTSSLESRYQFMRIGYFCLDRDSSDEKLIFNRTVSLKDKKKKK